MKKNIIISILTITFLINCGGDNIDNSRNKGESKSPQSTGSSKDIKSEFGILDKEFKNLEKEINSLTKRTKKDRKSDSEKKSIEDNKTKIITKYFKLDYDCSLYDKKVNLWWILCLQELLSKADKQDTDLNIIPDSRRFKEAKAADELKEQINNLKQKKSEIEDLIRDNDLIDSQKEFQQIKEKQSKIKFSNLAIISFSSNILKILNQIFTKRHGEEYKDKQIVNKEDIKFLIEKIDKTRNEYDSIKNNTEKSKKIERDEKEEDYAKALQKGLNKINEYINVTDK